MRDRTPHAVGAATIAARSAQVSAPALNADDKRQVFKGMVVAELESGFLRYSRRERLMRYAEKLRIPEFEAALLIAEAQFYSDEIDPVRFDSLATLDSVTRPEAWSVSMRLVLAAGVATFLDVLIILWLFG